MSIQSVSALEPHYFIRPLRTGDTVYFDNWDANWEKIRIYMYNSTTDSSEIVWEDRPYTNYDSGSIYKYTITADMEIEQYGYDYIIFTDDTNQQTINLGFVGNGYAYKVDAWQGDKRSGYWYLYNQSAVTIQYVKPISTGDTIYFDNSGTNWDEVRIYFFSTIGGAERYAWNDRPSMTHDSGSVYKFPITADLNIDQYQDNHVIFTDGSDAQTIDLGFVESGYAYKVESWMDGKAAGYWYVYDKTALIDAVANAKNYLAKLDCLSDSDSAPLRYAIIYAELAINSEVPVETEVVGNKEEYWNQVDTEIVHLDSIMQYMIGLYGESPTTCEDVPGPDDPDDPVNPDKPVDPDTPDHEDDITYNESSSIDGSDNDNNDDLAVPNTGAGTTTNTSVAIAIGTGLCGIVLVTIVGMALCIHRKH